MMKITGSIHTRAKQDYVESRMDEVRHDPAQFLRDFGLEDRMA